jgi:hypothetical protein
MPSYSVAGPIPPALLAAKTIFVSNAGADAGLFPEVFSGGSGLSSEPFSGDPDRAYTEFYTALKNTGDYTLVGDPFGADLILEIRLTAPYGPTNPNRQNGAPDPCPCSGSGPTTGPPTTSCGPSRNPSTLLISGRITTGTSIRRLPRSSPSFLKLPANHRPQHTRKKVRELCRLIPGSC